MEHSLQTFIVEMRINSALNIFLGGIIIILDKLPGLAQNSLDRAIVFNGLLPYNI